MVPQGAGHGDALPTLLEVLEQEAEDRRHRRINRLRRESRLWASTGAPGSHLSGSNNGQDALTARLMQDLAAS